MVSVYAHFEVKLVCLLSPSSILEEIQILGPEDSTRG